MKSPNRLYNMPALRIAECLEQLTWFASSLGFSWLDTRSQNAVLATSARLSMHLRAAIKARAERLREATERF